MLILSLVLKSITILLAIESGVHPALLAKG